MSGRVYGEPHYGETNNLGQSWDGKQWRNPPTTPAQSVQQMFRDYETLKQHEENGCHVDGCFECPRCRRNHYQVGGFELLCDGCSAAILTHDKGDETTKSNIRDWKSKEQRFWKDKTSEPEILERYTYREQFA